MNPSYQSNFSPLNASASDKNDPKPKRKLAAAFANEPSKRFSAGNSTYSPIDIDKLLGDIQSLKKSVEIPFDSVSSQGERGTSAYLNLNRNISDSAFQTSLGNPMSYSSVVDSYPKYSVQPEDKKYFMSESFFAQHKLGMVKTSETTPETRKNQEGTMIALPENQRTPGQNSPSPYSPSQMSQADSQTYAHGHSPYEKYKYEREAYGKNHQEAVSKSQFEGASDGNQEKLGIYSEETKSYFVGNESALKESVALSQMNTKAPPLSNFSLVENESIKTSTVIIDTPARSPTSVQKVEKESQAVPLLADFSGNTETPKTADSITETEEVSCFNVSTITELFGLSWLPTPIEKIMEQNKASQIASNEINRQKEEILRLHAALQSSQHRIGTLEGKLEGFEQSSRLEKDKSRRLNEELINQRKAMEKLEIKSTTRKTKSKELKESLVEFQKQLSFANEKLEIEFQKNETLQKRLNLVEEHENQNENLKCQEELMRLLDLSQKEHLAALEQLKSTEAERASLEWRLNNLNGEGTSLKSICTEQMIYKKFSHLAREEPSKMTSKQLIQNLEGIAKIIKESPIDFDAVQSQTESSRLLSSISLLDYQREIAKRDSMLRSLEDRLLSAHNEIHLLKKAKGIIDAGHNSKGKNVSFCQNEPNQQVSTKENFLGVPRESFVTTTSHLAESNLSYSRSSGNLGSDIMGKSKEMKVTSANQSPESFGKFPDLLGKSPESIGKSSVEMVLEELKKRAHFGSPRVNPTLAPLSDVEVARTEEDEDIVSLTISQSVTSYNASIPHITRMEESKEHLSADASPNRRNGSKGDDSSKSSLLVRSITNKSSSPEDSGFSGLRKWNEASLSSNSTVKEQKIIARSCYEEVKEEEETPECLVREFNDQKQNEVRERMEEDENEEAIRIEGEAKIEVKKKKTRRGKKKNKKSFQSEGQIRSQPSYRHSETEWVAVSSPNSLLSH